MNVPLSVLVALSVYFRLCSAQTSWIAAVDFSRLFWHSSIVVGDYAYIVGGEIWSLTGPQYVKTHMNQTVAIPLSKSWTNSTVQILATNYPTAFPHMKSPSLWWDGLSNSIWYFNGETSFITTTAADPLSIWAFIPSGSGGGTWNKKYTATDNIFSSLTRSYGCGSAYSPKAGYCLGGYASAHTAPGYSASSPTLLLSGLQVFNFEDKSWSNISSVGSSVGGWNVWPVCQYVAAYGRGGILVVIGGDTPTDQNHGSSGRSLRPMSNVTIYDIYNQRWFSQTATGDVPMGRMEACFVGAQGGDNSTYEIFIFGGWIGTQGSGNTDSHQVYVLSLPAFRWFRATESTASRLGHTCNVVGNRQMLSIGGYDPTATNDSTPDPFSYGLGIFDMTTWTWKSEYIADAQAYVPANQVYQFYSENSKYPKWDDPELQNLIEPNTTTKSSPTGTTTQTSSSAGATSSSSNSSTGAIVGGVLGGAAFLSIVGAAFYFLVIRRRRNRDQGGTHQDESLVPVEPKTEVQTTGFAELGPERPWELETSMTNNANNIPRQPAPNARLLELEA